VQDVRTCRMVAAEFNACGTRSGLHPELLRKMPHVLCSGIGLLLQTLASGALESAAALEKAVHRFELSCCFLPARSGGAAANG
jgi:hypothetical protein